MKLRQIKRRIALCSLRRKPLRAGKIHFKPEGSLIGIIDSAARANAGVIRVPPAAALTGLIDSVNRVNAGMMYLGAAVADATIISRQFAEALSPHQHAIDDWRLYPRDPG